MFKIVKKIEFNSDENKMKSVADTNTAIEIFNSIRLFRPDIKLEMLGENSPNTNNVPASFQESDGKTNHNKNLSLNFQQV